MARDAHAWEREHLGGATFPAKMPAPREKPMYVLDLANKVCQHLPEGWELRLCMESGAAWVELHNPDGDIVETPDGADKSLEKQVNDALCVAQGW